MNIKSTLAILVTLVGLNTAHAGSYDEDAMQDSSWNVGILYNSVVESMAPSVGFQNDHIQSNLGFNFSHDSSTNTNDTNVLLNLGMHSPLADKVDVSYGLTGAYGFNNDESGEDTYNAGVFTGISYNASSQMRFDFRILPVDHARDSSGGDTNTLFGEGEIGMRYSF